MIKSITLSNGKELPLLEECEECPKCFGNDITFWGQFNHACTCRDCGNEWSFYAPIYYTPEKFEAEGGVMADDMPVWIYHRTDWIVVFYDQGKKFITGMPDEFEPYIIIGFCQKPPEDWRPE